MCGGEGVCVEKSLRMKISDNSVGAEFSSAKFIMFSVIQFIIWLDSGKMFYECLLPQSE